MKIFPTIAVLLLFSLPLAAQEYGTAKEWMPDVTQYAQENFRSDAVITVAMFVRITQEQFLVEMNTETGKANGWSYIAYSRDLDSCVLLVVMDLPVVGHTIRMDPMFGGIAADTAKPNMSVENVPIDSDDALFILKQQSPVGQLLANDPNAVCNSAILTGCNRPLSGKDSVATWVFMFISETDTVVCAVNALTGELGGCASVLSSEALPLGKDIALGQSYPNPISLSGNTSLIIPWSSAAAQPAVFTVYDMLGHEVYSLEAKPGSRITVPASAFHKAGVYFYTLQSGATLLSKKLVVTR